MTGYMKKIRFEDTFGKSKKRKRPKLTGAHNMADLALQVRKKTTTYAENSDSAALSSAAMNNDAGMAYNDLMEERNDMGNVRGNNTGQTNVFESQSQKIKFYFTCS